MVAEMLCVKHLTKHNATENALMPIFWGAGKGVVLARGRKRVENWKITISTFVRMKNETTGE